LGRGAGRHNERGELRQAELGDGHHGQLREHDGGHGVPTLVPGDQLPDRDQHVHRGDTGELLAGHRGRARGPDGRRLRHVLRGVAALRPERHARHPVRSAVRLPGHPGAAAEDPQAEQVQDRVHGHTDMPGRSHLLRGHTGRAHQGLFRAQREPHHRDGGGDRRDPDAAGRGGIRAGQLDAVAHARSVLRHHHTVRLAQVRPPSPGADGRGAGAGGRGGGQE